MCCRPPRAYNLYNFMELHPEAGAVSGVYVTREENPEPLMYKEHGAGAYWEMPFGESAKPVPIFGAGAGFLLARLEAVADVIEHMKADNGGKELPIWADERSVPYSEEAENKQQIMWGHDIRFCKLLNEYGWPVYGHGGVLCGHVDVYTNKIYSLPEDAPGFKTHRQSTDYWNSMYASEGINSSKRRYPEMFAAVVDAIPDGSSVVELGCGTGILGTRLTATKQVKYKGYDISSTGIAMAKTRYLDAEVADAFDVEMDGYDTVVATELIEHYEREKFDSLMQKMNASNVRRFVFTVPDGGMPPETIPEHAVDFDRDMVDEYMLPYSNWVYSVTKVDKEHIMCVAEKSDG